VLVPAVLDANAYKYIAAAVGGRAAFVVTADPHLLALTEYGAVRIVRPRAFLDLLGI
jgi:predicted nucleic acid-binding protein